MDDAAIKLAILQTCVAIEAEWDAAVFATGIYRGINGGLCGRIKGGTIPFDKATDELRRIFSMWPEWSEDYSYPVPHPDPGSVDEAHMLACGDDTDAAYAYESEGFDKYSGPYGEARRRLLDFIIQTLSEELHNAV